MIFRWCEWLDCFLVLGRFAMWKKYVAIFFLFPFFLSLPLANRHRILVMLEVFA